MGKSRGRGKMGWIAFAIQAVIEIIKLFGRKSDSPSQEKNSQPDSGPGSGRSEDIPECGNNS